MSKKIILGDLHLGCGNGNDFLMTHQRKLFDVLVDYVKANGIKTLVQLGDWYDNKKIPSTAVIKFSNDVIDMLFNAGIDELIHIDGNHDLYDSKSSEVSSFDQIHAYRMGVVSVCDRIAESDNMILVPYLSNDKIIAEFNNHINNIPAAKLKQMLLIGHFDIAGFKMRDGMNCPEDKGLNREMLKAFHGVISGHYHIGQNLGNVVYVGVPYELEWGDYGHDQRFAVYDEETNGLSFVANPHAKLFRKLYFADGKLTSDIGTNLNVEKDLADKIVKLYVKDMDMATSAYTKLSKQLVTSCRSVDIIDKRTIDLSVNKNDGQRLNIANVSDIIDEYFGKLALKTQDVEVFTAVRAEFDRHYAAESQALAKTLVKNFSLAFNYVRIKNLMSFGNVEARINLNLLDFVLIAGSNGAGKTSILEAIFFALYGKSFRGVNKADLINKVNGSDVFVGIEFRSNNDLYVVERGIKPDTFTVHCNGVKIESTGAPDLQKKLDLVIPDMAIIKQTILISMMDYIPFMRLKLDKRRAYIEEYFDSEVFNNMLKPVKAIYNTNVTDLLSLNRNIESANAEIALHQNEQNEWSAHSAGQIAVFDKNIADYTAKITGNIVATAALNAEIIAINENEIRPKLTEIQTALGEVQGKLHKIAGKKDEFNKVVKFMAETSICPIMNLGCGQLSDVEFKNTKTAEYQGNLKRLEVAEVEFRAKITEHNTSIKAYDESLRKINDLRNRINLLTQDSNSCNFQISSTNNNKKLFNEKMQTQDTTITAKIQAKRDAIAGFGLKILGIQKQQVVLATLIEILDDKKGTGIKNLIVEKWVEYIEIEVNKYLEIMNAGYYTKFDNNFDIVVYPYNKKYEALSAGEKQRFDMALLFVFNDISRIKNAGTTANLLFLDEVLDSSLDMTAVSGLVSIFKMFSSNEKTCFVVSHRDETKVLFSKIINVTKSKFTELEFVGF